VLFSRSYRDKVVGVVFVRFRAPLHPVAFAFTIRNQFVTSLATGSGIFSRKKSAA
jgi:hypothetical protein